MSVILWYVHGWGFDASFWDDLSRRLPGMTVATADRGYFGTASAPPPEQPCIVVAHSLGAMLALADPPPRCRGLIAINGFDCFTARAGFAGIARRVVDRMLARLDREPGGTLADFRRRCGFDAPFPPPDTAALRRDLLILRDGDCRAHTGKWTLPLLVIDGADDPIVPPDMRARLFASVAQADRVTHPSAGHLLPLSDPDFCAERIRGFVEACA